MPAAANLPVGNVLPLRCVDIATPFEIADGERPPTRTRSHVAIKLSLSQTLFTVAQSVALDLSGLWIADMERVARRRCNGVVTVNLPASTEVTSLPEIISRCFDDLTSLLTHALVLVVTLVT